MQRGPATEYSPERHVGEIMHWLSGVVDRQGLYSCVRDGSGAFERMVGRVLGMMINGALSAPAKAKAAAGDGGGEKMVLEKVDAERAGIVMFRYWLSKINLGTLWISTYCFLARMYGVIWVTDVGSLFTKYVNGFELKYFKTWHQRSIITIIHSLIYVCVHRVRDWSIIIIMKIIQLFFILSYQFHSFHLNFHTHNHDFAHMSHSYRIFFNQSSTPLILKKYLTC